MSPVIAEEGWFLLYSVLMGLVITVVYDILRIFRRVVRHGTFLVSVEDLLFWVACSFGIFNMLYYENNGMFRWFTVLGAAVGMLIYKKTFSDLFVRSFTALFCQIGKILTKVLYFLCTPVRAYIRWQKKMVKKAEKKAKSSGRIWKKQLTLRLKMVKIILCKHKKKRPGKTEKTVKRE